MDGLTFRDPDDWPGNEEDREDTSLWRYDEGGYDEDGWRRSLQPSEWRLLEPYRQGHLAQLGDSDALRAALDDAEDERPLQRFLEARPHLLTACFLMGGHGRFLRAQVRLGSQYVPDFMIGEASSMGLFWTLVELESPREPMFLNSGEWAGKARHAIYQVQTWRRWLAENIDYARKPPTAGLGLVDIEATPAGLILIGRRSDAATDADWLRKDLLKAQNIRVHTYDELLDRVRGSEAMVRRLSEASRPAPEV